MKCSAENCLDNYNESARQLLERVNNHERRGTKSHISKHSIENEHVEGTQKDLKVISHFDNNRLKRKITVVFLIRQELPSLNV